jgi:Fic family protein
MLYNWQQKDWPDFRYDTTRIEDILFAFAEETGHITGILKALPADIQIESLIDLMVAEAIKTSEIEGEYISRQDIISSIRNNLGLNKTPEKIKDKKAQGIGKLMVDVRNTYSEPLTEAKLFEWHTMLMSGSPHINSGCWRSGNERMQVISGTVGKEKIHFEAPPSGKVPEEIKQFLKWFNDSAPGGNSEIRKAPLRSAIAHLYFESIHPFEDGNGRIGRAVAEKALSQTLGRPVILSLSKTIEANKKAYYNALQKGQRSNEITDWIRYFAEVILSAQREARQLIEFTLKKSIFFDRFKAQLNERQLKVIRKMFEAGPDGFEGVMNATKYISITKTSKATATRDLQLLAEIKAFLISGGGRSTRYSLNME